MGVGGEDTHRYVLFIIEFNEHGCELAIMAVNKANLGAARATEDVEILGDCNLLIYQLLMYHLLIFVFVAGWRHALRSEWPFIIIIK